MEEADSLLGAMADKAMSRRVARAWRTPASRASGSSRWWRWFGGFASSDHGFASRLGAPWRRPGLAAADPAASPCRDRSPRDRSTRRSVARRARAGRVTTTTATSSSSRNSRRCTCDIVKAASESIAPPWRRSSTPRGRRTAASSRIPCSGARSEAPRPTSPATARQLHLLHLCRDPNTRFRSSYAQAICRERCTLCAVRGKEKMYTPTIPRSPRSCRDD